MRSVGGISSQRRKLYLEKAEVVLVGKAHIGAIDHGIERSVAVEPLLDMIKNLKLIHLPPCCVWSTYELTYIFIFIYINEYEYGNSREQ